MVGIFLVGGCKAVKAGSIGKVGHHVSVWRYLIRYCVVDIVRGLQSQCHPGSVVIEPVSIVYAGCGKLVYNMQDNLSIVEGVVYRMQGKVLQ